MNTQPAENKVWDTYGAIELVGSPFYTIQGEGPYAGHPAVFIRLAGCNLQCPGCDTDYTTNRNARNPDVLAKDVRLLADGRTDLVVLTGGEPFRQRLGPALRHLIDAKFHVQIETNGTLYQNDMPWYGNMSIVCSPKTMGINNDIKPYIKHLKYVLEADQIDPNDGLPLSALENGIKVARPWDSFTKLGGIVWVQPFDAGDPMKNRANQDAVLDVALKFGYRISLQLHKLLRLP